VRQWNNEALGKVAVEQGGSGTVGGLEQGGSGDKKVVEE
jgi:hypothetical protein